MSSETAKSVPPLAFAGAVCLAALIAFALLRIGFYDDYLVPLTYALPILLGLWHKNRPLHYGLVVAFSGLAAAEVFFIAPDAAHLIPGAASYVMMLANIWVVGFVADGLIVSQRRLTDANCQLEQANVELEASNEELATREEEISSQNEELQRQTEELEQQTEELQDQAEELQRQQEELQQLNEESAGRERVLQALLEISATHLHKRGPAANGICNACLATFGDEISAALVLTRDNDRLLLQGYCGIELHEDMNGDGSGYTDPLAWTVIEEGRTVAVEDLQKTPDIPIPTNANGPKFRAALATPIDGRGRASGVLALYSTRCRRWSDADFRVAQWLAAQGSLVLLSARLQKELDDRTSQAEEAARQKTRFLAAVSHDVRTPANAISLMAELIKQADGDPQLSQEMSQMTSALQANAKLLVDLVSDVLDLSRFDSGRIDLDLSDFSLQDVIHAETSRYRPLAEAAGLELYAAAPRQPIWLRTDRMKLARVLGNLIGNAVKFTEVGRVQVVCGRNDRGDVELHVRDTGVGISPEHLEHIYDEFYQIKNPERDRSKGTGLGLAICKRLIDAIECSLSVVSRVGEGTDFTLRVPVELVVPPPVVASSKTTDDDQRHNPLAGLRVLIVEDHETTRVAVSSLLAAQGATIDQAEDARSALRALGHYSHDVMLLDLMLPDMDGREILKHLQYQRPPKLRCLLAVSGDVTEARRNEIESLGADGLVPKPVQIDALTAAICKHLKTFPDVRSRPSDLVRH